METISPIELALRRVDDMMEHMLRGQARDPAGAIASEHVRSGGKRRHAHLALAACHGFGVTLDAAVPWAVSCELMHEGGLVHDDIEDSDRLRRGLPTVWAQCGTAQAINAGDLLIVLATSALDRATVPDGIKWQLALQLARAAERAVRGQALDQSLRADRRLTFADWQETATGKTGALLALPVRGAALLAGRGDSEVLAAPFEALGLLCQLVDDVLDLFGNGGDGRFGSDAREGRVSALVALHLEGHPEDRDAVLTVLDWPSEIKTRDDFVGLAERFTDGGTLTAALQRVGTLTQQIVGAPLPDPLRAIADDLLGELMTPIGTLAPPLRAGAA